MTCDNCDSAIQCDQLHNTEIQHGTLQHDAQRYYHTQRRQVIHHCANKGGMIRCGTLPRRDTIRGAPRRTGRMNSIRAPCGEPGRRQVSHARSMRHRVRGRAQQPPASGALPACSNWAEKGGLSAVGRAASVAASPIEMYYDYYY